MSTSTFLMLRIGHRFCLFPRPSSYMQYLRKAYTYADCEHSALLLWCVSKNICSTFEWRILEFLKALIKKSTSTFILCWIQVSSSPTRPRRPLQWSTRSIQIKAVYASASSWRRLAKICSTGRLMRMLWLESSLH